MATAPPIQPRSPKRLAGRLEYLVRNRLWAQILIAMVLGIGIGLSLSPSGGAIVSTDTAQVIASWVALPGNLFLALIQMVVVPLVLSSIVIGIAGNSDTDFLRRAGLRIAPYFVATTVVAVLIGASLALWIEPGHYIDMGDVAVDGEAAISIETDSDVESFKRSLPQRIVDVIPTNPTSAVVQRSMFQIVILAIFLAVALASITPARAKPVMDLMSSLQEISMKVVSWAMAMAPAAVFGILARRSPLKFLANIREVQLLAFSTSSSAAVMPLSMETADKKLGVDQAIARFIIPLGATVNMDGTALYQMIAAIFLTQLFGIELGYPELALLAATTVGASIGSPSTPGVGIVILATIVQNLGVPAAGIALILGVDRILDMSRTAVNVTGDLAASVVMSRWLNTDENKSTF